MAKRSSCGTRRIRRDTTVRTDAHGTVSRGALPGVLVRLSHVAALAIPFLILYVWVWQQRRTTDIQAHVGFITDYLVGKRALEPNFLFYLTTYTASGFSKDYPSLLFTALIVIAVSVYLKFLVSWLIAKSFWRQGGTIGDTTGPWTVVALNAGILSLLFCHNVIVARSDHPDWMYLGYFPPNVWHNSTVIFLMPMALLLFWFSYQYLVRHDRPWIHFLLITALVVLNVISKPSYLFAFVGAFPMMALRKHRLGRKFWVSLLVTGGTVALILVLAKVLFDDNLPTARSAGQPLSATLAPGIAIAPMKWWRAFSDSMFRTVVFSSLFPLAVLAIYFREALRHDLFVYALFTYIVGLAVSIIFVETGPRAEYGNLIWQTIVCNYIWFFVSVLFVGQAVLKKGRWDWRSLLACSLLALHFIMGLRYIHHLVLAPKVGDWDWM